MNQLVVGVDFSPGSEVAVVEAVDIARRLGGRIVLVHAAAAPEHPGAVAGTRDALAADHRALDALRDRVAAQGCPVSGRLIEGFPDEVVPAAAREVGADLVVVGSHGRTGFKRFLLGSVAERVVRFSSCDVLVARPGTGAEDGYRRVLVATDFSEGADRALATACVLAAADVPIDVVHCWQLPPSAMFYGATIDAIEALRRTIEGRIDALVAEMRAIRPEIAGRLRFHAVEESPAQGIQHWLDEHPHDLVVTGSHGRRGFRRMALGSVAEATVRHAPCSVLVAHRGPGVH